MYIFFGYRMDMKCKHTGTLCVKRGSVWNNYESGYHENSKVLEKLKVEPADEKIRRYK